VTNRLASYLQGLGPPGFYTARAFHGGAQADFGVALLFRLRDPFGGVSSTATKYLVGNAIIDGSSNARGWAIAIEAGPQPDMTLALLWGDGSQNEHDTTQQIDQSPLTDRTMLVHAFFLKDGGNVTALLYVNGVLVSSTTAAGYSPAPSNNLFTLGAGVLGNAHLGAEGVGICGFAFIPQIAGATLTAKLARAQALVDAQVADTLQIADLADAPDLGMLYSVRRTLSSVKPIFVPARGNQALTIAGDLDALSIAAADPLFSDGHWGTGGGSSPVTSVFARIGAVIAQLGDYAASLLTNDSGVSGATVKDALDTLNAAIGALQALVASLEASDIGNDSGVAGATVKDALDTLNAAIGALQALIACF